MQIAICQKRQNFRIPYFRPSKCRPLLSSARGGCPLRPDDITDWCGCSLPEVVWLANDRQQWRRITGLNDPHGSWVLKKKKNFLGQRFQSAFRTGLCHRSLDPRSTPPLWNRWLCLFLSTLRVGSPGFSARGTKRSVRSEAPKSEEWWGIISLPSRPEGLGNIVSGSGTEARSKSILALF